MKGFALLAAAAVIGQCHAHMRVSYPKPRGDPTDPATGSPDYSLTSPLGGASRPFPCQGKSATNYTTTVQAGTQLPVTIIGSAIHGGNGHCQYSLSYDGGRTFVSLLDQVGTCFDPTESTGSYTYNVPLPSDLPSGPAILQWTWYNKIGNREIYATCSDLTINGGPAQGALTGPRVFIAQLPGTPSLPEATNGQAFAGASYFGAGARPVIRVDNGGGSVLVAKGSNPVDVVQADNATPGEDGSYLSGHALSGGAAVSAGGTTGAQSSSTASSTAASTATTSSPSGFTTVTTQRTTSSGRRHGHTKTRLLNKASPAPSPQHCPTVGIERCLGRLQYRACASGGHWVIRSVAPGTTCENVGTASIRLVRRA